MNSGKPPPEVFRQLVARHYCFLHEVDSALRDPGLFHVFDKLNYEYSIEHYWICSRLWYRIELTCMLLNFNEECSRGGCG